MDSSLSRVPPVWPSPRPDSWGTAAPHAATSGASGSVILSPTPPVECLSTVGRATEERSSRTPEAIIASVHRAISAADIPRIRIAMASADICSSATSPRVYAAITQSIAASLSVPPSRLVRMTSTTSKAVSAKGEILPTEREGQDLGHRLGPLGGVDEEVRAAVLPQQLPAPPAGHEHVAAVVDAGERDEPAAAGGVQRRHQPALRAEPDPVRGVLHVAADDDPAVVDQRGRPHRELRVRRVGAAHRFQRGPAQRRPVDLAHMTCSSEGDVQGPDAPDDELRTPLRELGELDAGEAPH